MSSKADTGQHGLLGRGIYDSVEIARLIHRHPETVARWVTKRPGSPPILEPRAGGLFGFLDLISLYVVSELMARKVKRNDIIRGGEYVSGWLDTPYPFAHRRIATVGRSFFAELDVWVDAGLHGQRAFDDVIAPLIRPIEYGVDDLATIWRPHDLVWINPQVQAGTPCIDGSRVPTRLIVELLRAGERVPDIADDYRVSRESIGAALAYEESLGEAA